MKYILTCLYGFEFVPLQMLQFDTKLNIIGWTFTEKITFLHWKCREDVTSPPIYWPNSKCMAIESTGCPHSYCPHQSSFYEMILGQVLPLHFIYSSWCPHNYCPHNSYGSILQNDHWSSSTSTLYRALDVHTVTVPIIHKAVLHKWSLVKSYLYQGFSRGGGTGVPPRWRKFGRSPPSGTRPHFPTRACPLPPDICPRKFSKF